jgi:hypothetical protein
MAKAMKTMKTMKAMAAMKAMKAMKKKPISAKLARRHLFAGKITKTKGGLSASAFKKTSTGKIVSKKRSANAKTSLGAWTAAVQKARKALNIKGFAVIKKGTPLYKKAKELYSQ